MTAFQQDAIQLKQKKGTWARFIRLFFKCNLPVFWIGIYICAELFFVNIGVDETDATAQLFAGDTSAALVTKLIVLMLVNLLAGSLVILLRNLTSAAITRNTRKVLLNKVFRLPMSYFQDEDPRQAVYKIVDRAVAIDAGITIFLIPILTAGYTMLKTFTRVFRYDHRLSLIMLGFIPLNILIAFLFGRISYSLHERDVSINTGLTRKLSEMVTNIPLAKVFAKEERQSEKCEEYIERLYRVNIRSSWMDQLKDLSETAVSLVQTLAVCLAGTLLLNDNAITERAWISFYLFSTVFSGAVNQLMMYWNNIKTIQGGAESIADVMDAEEERTDGIICTELAGDIHLENVSFGYHKDKDVLKGMTCTFPDHHVTALLGPSGCGKTTLTCLLTGMYPYRGDALTVGGEDINTCEMHSFRNNFTVVSQNSLLFSGTLRENIVYGCGDVSEEEIVLALQKAGAYDFVQAMPEGLDSRLEEYGDNLSGGQKQRLALARALLSKGHYLILDEPVSGVDALSAKEIMQVLKTVQEDKLTILITHTPSVLSLADYAVVIENGKCTAEGKIEEVQKENAFVRALVQKGGYTDE